jgi:hypothetical protein
MPARDLEKLVVWNGKSNSNGRGMEIIAALSTARAGLSWYAKHVTPTPSQVPTALPQPGSPTAITEPSGITGKWAELENELKQLQNGTVTRAKLEAWPTQRAELASCALDLWKISPPAERSRLASLLSSAYSQAPYDLPGLVTRLEEAVSEKELKDEILKSVLATMKLTANGVDPATVKRPQPKP